jgi:hypothetical protein
MNKAVDEVRGGEARELVRQGYQPIPQAHPLVLPQAPRRTSPDNQRTKLADLLEVRPPLGGSVPAQGEPPGLLEYTNPGSSGWFLDKWCTRVPRSRLEPINESGPYVRGHRELILNWFRAKKEISAAVEGMNANAKLALKKASGFRTFEVLETTLYHELGHVPEPASVTHRFR